jgi:hypothetical protein
VLRQRWLEPQFAVVGKLGVVHRKMYEALHRDGIPKVYKEDVLRKAYV